MLALILNDRYLSFLSPGYSQTPMFTATRALSKFNDRYHRYTRRGEFPFTVTENK